MLKQIKTIDEEFLKQLDEMRHKVLYVRISSYNPSAPIEEIQGKITGGNITVNGSSAMRRTGNLTMFADATQRNISNADNIISINKTIIVEIGVDQNIDASKGSPYYYKLGTFVISAASIQRNMQGLNISMSLKDLMAKLNGECGGGLIGGITHSPVLEEINGKYTEKPVPYYDLINSLLNEYTDISEDQREITIVKKNADGSIRTPNNIIEIEQNNKPVYWIKNTARWTSSAPLYATEGTYGNNENKALIQTLTLTKPTEDNYLTFNFNEDVGYVLTEFTYPTASELTSSAGDSVASVLDKIKNSLGNYEYFFDVDGKFHFQEIENGLNQGGSKLDNLEEALSESYIQPNSTPVVYEFKDDLLISSYSNSPQYSAIKNDLTVWGARGDNKIPIRYRLVIDSTPFTDPDAIFNVVFETDSFGVLRARQPKNGEIFTSISAPVVNNVKKWDWRHYYYLNYIINEKDPDGYGKELEEELPKIMNIQTGKFYAVSDSTEVITDVLNGMNYFLDIIDPKNIANETVRNALEQLTVSKIGRRTKSIQDQYINTLFNPKIYKDVVFIEMNTPNTDAIRAMAINQNWNFSQVPQYLMQYIEIGSAINSAYDAIRSMLHEVLSYNNAISLSAIPIYHLDANQMIYVKDNESGIDGKYMINNLSIPLAPEGMMNISAKLAVNRI